MTWESLSTVSCLFLLSLSELERHGGGISQKGNEKHSFALPKSLGFIYPRESFMLSQSKKH
jgi:hypothetical protein